MVKSLPAVQETRARSLRQEDPLEKGMATHSSIPAWRIPRTEEPGGCSPWGHKESDTTERLTHTRSSEKLTKKHRTYPVGLSYSGKEKSALGRLALLDRFLPSPEGHVAAFRIWVSLRRASGTEGTAGRRPGDGGEAGLSGAGVSGARNGADGERVCC